MHKINKDLRTAQKKTKKNIRLVGRSQIITFVDRSQIKILNVSINWFYKLLWISHFIKPSSNTIRCSLKSLNVFASNMWDMIPDEIKSFSAVEIFKNKMRKWWPTDCDCHFCPACISKIGYVIVVN